MASCRKSLPAVRYRCRPGAGTGSRKSGQSLRRRRNSVATGANPWRTPPIVGEPPEGVAYLARASASRRADATTREGMSPPCGSLVLDPYGDHGLAPVATGFRPLAGAPGGWCWTSPVGGGLGWGRPILACRRAPSRSPCQPGSAPDWSGRNRSPSHHQPAWKGGSRRAG